MSPASAAAPLLKGEVASRQGVGQLDLAEGGVFSVHHGQQQRLTGGGIELATAVPGSSHISTTDQTDHFLVQAGQVRHVSGLDCRGR